MLILKQRLFRALAASLALTLGGTFALAVQVDEQSASETPPAERAAAEQAADEQAADEQAASEQDADESSAEPKKPPHPVELNEGAIKLAAPGAWEVRKPATRIVEFEFAIAAIGDDEYDGRLTIMGAGGSVEANINRWYAQFARQTRSSTDTVKIAGVDVHIVDVTGTYRDSRGPFAPVELREDYRMIGAIIDTEKLGKYFLKLYGPAKTIAANADAFTEMLESLEVTGDGE